jgi:folate-binding protein YgfZ
MTMKVVIDRSAWGRLRVTGADRARFLQGLTTVNVDKLGEGQHGWGAILNPKGRVLSVVDIARPAGDDAFIVASQPSIAEATRALLEKYAVMDDVAFEPLTGPAHQIWDDPATAWQAPIVEGAGEAARPEDDAEVERLRIRAGFLRYGVDVDDGHFPFETPLVTFLDYGKGCYVGQEPVFRVHAQGNAAHALRGLRIEGEAPIAPGQKLDAPAKGEVTSSIADGGAVRALAYLHRTCWEPGGTVTVAGRRATVHELPW